MTNQLATRLRDGFRLYRLLIGARIRARVREMTHRQPIRKLPRSD